MFKNDFYEQQFDSIINTKRAESEHNNRRKTYRMK